MTPSRLQALRDAAPGIEAEVIGSKLWIRPPPGLDWELLGKEVERLQNLPAWRTPEWRIVARLLKCRDCRYFELNPGHFLCGQCRLHGYAVTKGRSACGYGELTSGPAGAYHETESNCPIKAVSLPPQAH